MEDLVIGPDGHGRPLWATASPELQHYYDTEWGLPVTDERGLFERLSLEAFQSGLSWATILAKREAFRRAFANFIPDKVAVFDEQAIKLLMQDAAIVRNQRKIEATITNARATVDLRSRGGLSDLIWSFKPANTPRPQSLAEIPTSSPESIALAKELKRQGFRFVGPTTMYALMEAIGMVDTHLMHSHRRGSSGIWPASA
ncbi:DNA-3-methyladenine glycosylase I [Glutamicibacter uratoxydans]|uniref:DNA-3-methyladenine glycosylase I n=1 Tax=Glutamicibacter uratoxydans TaxID=43667 RepID=UPI003D6EFF0F